MLGEGGGGGNSELRAGMVRWAVSGVRTDFYK